MKIVCPRARSVPSGKLRALGDLASPHRQQLPEQQQCCQQWRKELSRFFLAPCAASCTTVGISSVQLSLTALGSGGISAGLPWSLQAPSAGLPHRKSGKLARGVAEAFLLDVRLTSDRHFHHKILDLWKQSGSFSVLFSVGLHISAKTNSSASWKMTI